MTSDENTSSEEPRSDSDASSDSGSQNSVRLIDDEAEESDSYAAAALLDYRPQVAFPQFMRLPEELRRQVWEVFCPDLLARARVLSFTVSPSSATMRRPGDYSVKEHWTLADQTEELRAMLATHRESRSMVLRRFPDKLRMDAGSGDAEVWFSRERDVVNIDEFVANGSYHLPGFAEELQQAAIQHSSRRDLAAYDGRITHAKAIFPNLKRLYICMQDFTLKRRERRWCGSDFVHRYMVQTYEKEMGLGEGVEVLYCWPDVDQHPDFARYAIPSVYPASQNVADMMQGARDAGVEVLPMVAFEFEGGLAEWEHILGMKDNPVLNDDSDDGSGEEDTGEDGWQEETDSNAYESEGIDDAEIEEQSESSEDEIVPTGDAGRFSSPEVSDDDDDDDEAEDAAPVQRSTKRKIVSDSEDEEPQTKRVRSRAAAMDSDEEEEEEEEPQTRGRQSRAVVVSDDEDEDEENLHTGSGNLRAVADEDEVENADARSTTRPRRAVTSDSEDENDGSESDSDLGQQEEEGGEGEEEEEEEEEGEEPKRTSLAERLRRAREEHPVSSGSEGASQDDDAEEDDEEDDDDDDEEEDEEGLLEVMAEEGDEDDEDEDGW